MSRAFIRRLALGLQLVAAASSLITGCDEAPIERPSQSAQALTTSALTPSADSFVKSGSPNQAQGALDYLRIQDSGNNRTLVRFDPSAIATAIGSGTLTAAFLELSITDNANNWSSDGRAVDVHRLTNTAWTETGATWNCALDSNPSNGSADCSGGNAWTMGSGSNPWASTPTDTQLIANGQTGVVSWDVTADVAAFLSGTTKPELGRRWFRRSPLGDAERVPQTPRPPRDWRSA